MAVALRDGERALDLWPDGPPVSPKEFLLQLPPGPYTVMRTARSRQAISSFEFHVARLAHSAVLLELLPGARAEDEARVGRALEGRLRAHAAAAVEAFEWQHAPPDGEECMLTVLLERLPQAGASVAPASPEEQAARLRLWTHAAALHCLPPERPVVVEVFGPPRRLPTAKDSRWIRERAGLEARRGAGAVEVVLTDGAGALLEGLVSNLVVVRRDGALQAASRGVLPATSPPPPSAPPPPPRRPAPRPHAPRLAERAQWAEAFLCSTAREAVPVGEMRVREGPGAGESVRLEAPGPVTRRVQALLRDALRRDAAPFRQPP
eukprot:tig00021795_g23533.t1